MFLKASTPAISSLLQELYSLSYLHKLTGRTRPGVKREGGGGYQCVNGCVLFPHCAVLFVLLCVCVCACTCVCHYSCVCHNGHEFLSRLCPYVIKLRTCCFMYCSACTLTDRVPSLKSGVCVFVACRRSRISAASATRPSARNEDWTST